MNFNAEDYLGSWISFDSITYSTDPAMLRVYAEGEADRLAHPDKKSHFRGDGDPKEAWHQVCSTVNEENQMELSGCTVTQEPDGIYVEWFAENNVSLGRHRYVLESVIEKGLEGKPNFVFFAPEAPETWRFRYVMAMKPMPEREARNEGGLISHAHFQFSAKRETLLNADNEMQKKHWYPTFCDGRATMLEKCNIVRVMLGLPQWEKLPE